MGDYAASIRVGTKIETKQASTQLLSLENRLTKTKDKIMSLSDKMKELEQRKAPTKEYKELQTQLEAATKELGNLISRQNDLEAIGIKSGALWNEINEEIASAGIKVDEIKESMERLETAGKAFSLGSDSKEYETVSQQLKHAQNDLVLLQQKHDEAIGKMESSEQRFGQNAVSTFKKIAESAKSAFGKAASFTRSALSKVSGTFQKIGNVAKGVFQRLHRDTRKQNSLFSTMKSRLGSIALSLLVFNWISKGFRAMIAGMKEGLQNLAQYSREYNAVMSDMVSALATLKNAFATAFAPIATIAIPYITQLINYLTAAVNKVAQFVSALTGKTTWIKAKKQTIDYAQSLNKVSKSAKEAYRSLASFDELNILSKNEVSESGSGGLDPSDMFEEVPIDSKIKELSDKFRDILSKLFEPLKTAWDRQGKKVMDAWKYALKEISALVKSIGSDFLEVWTQEATVRIFEDILLILADIGLVIGNLAKRFREAWEENETGKRILENIRDLIGIIVKNMKEAADFTVDWSDKLDFSPLLESFEEFTRSLAGPVDFISGVLSDLYTQVLLPLAKWTIEKGLPEFLDILTDFNNKVNWDGLRQRLSQFWEHLEPFAETIGDGLLIFIRKLSDRLAEFVSSGAFESFLARLEEWMDEVEPEDVANAIERIAEVLIGLKLALLGFEAIKGVTVAFTAIRTFLELFGKGNGSVIAGEMTTAAGGVSGLATALGTLAAVATGFAIVEMLKEPLISLGEAAGMSAQQADYMRDRYKGLEGNLNLIKDPVSMVTNGIQGLGWEMSNAVGASAAFETAMGNIAEGAIYTDEQLEKMRKNYGFTEEDIESLRQEMLEANPALRDLADGFGLFDASAETLKNVSDGMKLIEDKTLDSMEAFEQYAEKAGYTSEAIGILKDQMQEGLGQSIEDFKTGIEKSGQSIDDFKENVTSVGQSIADLEEDFTVAGHNTADGFIQGFENGAEQVDATTGKFSNNFIDRIKSLFGIHSPSTVMAEIGAFIIDGLIKGIGDKKSDLTDTLTNVYDTVKGILDRLKNFVSDMVSSIKDKISSITSGVSSAWSSVTSWGSSSFGRSTNYMMHSSDIPELATGGITTGTTIAKIGEAGREAVLPLENNTGWMDTLADKINGSGTYTFVAEIDGREIFREVIDRGEIYSKSTGKQAFSY